MNFEFKKIISQWTLAIKVFRVWGKIYSYWEISEYLQFPAQFSNIFILCTVQASTPGSVLICVNDSSLIFLRYPHLSPKYKESFDVGCNLFAKFSAYIKNTQKEANKSKISFLNLYFLTYLLILTFSMLK
jgi:hypothetical protein